MQHIAVPVFYFEQDTSGNVPGWTSLENGMPTASIVVCDLNIGQGPIKAQYMLPLLKHGQDNGLKVLGYVPTANAKQGAGRTVSDIKGYVSQWYSALHQPDGSLWQPDGIFFDEGPTPKDTNDPSDPQHQNFQSFYTTIYNDVKGRQNVRDKIVMLNAADYDVEWVMQAADFVILWEDTYFHYVNHYAIWPDSGAPGRPIPSWWTHPNYSPSRIVHVVHTCTTTTDMQNAVTLSCQRGVGYVYVYDGNSGCGPQEQCPDPIDPVGHPRGGYWRLPTYWNGEVLEVQKNTICPPGTGVDTQAPTTTCTTSPVPNAAGWNNSNVTVTLHATDNPGGSGVASISYSLNGAPQPPVSGDTLTFQVATEGQTVIAYHAVDKANNTETPEKSCTVKLDKTPPTITVLAPTDGATYTLNQQVNASYLCNDTGGSGPPKTCTGTVPSGSAIDTSTYGTKTFTVTSEDNAGNKTTKTVTYNVFFNFSGFFPPVDNWPKLNKVNAGANVPVKFSLGGNQGLDIFAQDYPKSQEIPCNNPSVEVAGTVPTSSPGGSGLTYNAGSDQYHYNWKTEKKWEGTCRQLVVKLKDGSFHRANFQFT